MWGKATAFAAVLLGLLSSSEAYAQMSCAAFNVTAARVGGTALTLGPYTLALGPGDTITVIDTAGGFPTNRLTVGSTTSTFSGVGRTSITVATAGTYTVTAALDTPAPAGTAQLFCTPGRSASALQQNTSNAQTAIANGLRTMQNYQEWVTKGLMGSFGMTRGGDIAVTPRRQEAAPVSLASKERETSEELAADEIPKQRRFELQGQLDAIRRDLRFEHLSKSLAKPDKQPPASDDVEVQAAQGRGPSQAAAPQVHLDTCNLSDACQGTPSDNRWNAWFEGRVVGVTDSPARTNALGFAGATGLDYKVKPWLAIGMSVGVESYEAAFGLPGMRTGSIGVTALPYFGMRLDDNIFAEGFLGYTRLSYNTNVTPAISGAFGADRFFFGGALTGVWYDGRWRFQPSILAAYGVESQNGYTDSSGTLVSGQTVNYGRIAAGPEIGYVLRDESRNWSIEPFVLLKGNVDFASNPVYSFANGMAVVRSGTQAFGLLGGGVSLQLDRGFYLRVQGSYDSIGIPGLDVWSGRLRAGVSF